VVKRTTLDEMDVSFLDEKDQSTQFDVGERISFEIKRRGYRISGLRRTTALRRGSMAEPIYLGSEYEGIVHHQWYTTRAETSQHGNVDDVPSALIWRSLDEVLERAHAEPRELGVVVGLRIGNGEVDRLRNARACLAALNLQDLERWRYRLVVVEQDCEPRIGPELCCFADRYIFAYNPGPYNRGWALNVGSNVAAATKCLCLMDGDILPPSSFLRTAMECFESGDRAVRPYSAVVYLDAASTERAIRDRFAQSVETFDVCQYRGDVFTDSNGGCLWVEPSTYRQIHGHDERFSGWGCEDRDFWRRLTQVTPIKTVECRLAHLDHPRPQTDDRWAIANSRLLSEISAGHTAQWAGPMGNAGLYGLPSPGRSVPISQACRRDWENWSQWERARIEEIVADEISKPNKSSARCRLVQLMSNLGHRILDVGCGPGALWTRSEQYLALTSWVGIDVTYPMLQVARSKFPDIPLCNGDSSALPFADHAFEVVLLRHVLEHLPLSVMERTLSEAMRVAHSFVVLDFYVPPVGRPRHTRRVGENFLETQWAMDDILGPIKKAGWHMLARLDISCERSEPDQVWILSSNDMPFGANVTDGPGAEPSPKISIIMPTYRRSHTILRALKSIWAQTYRNWEVILIDNAGDGGYWFADRRIRVYTHCERASASYARNEGLQCASGDLVCFFDDDDEMFSTYLQTFVGAFEKNPNAKMVCSGMIVTDSRTDFSRATPECCLRKEFATRTWNGRDWAQDQAYFGGIVSAHGWSEKRGDIVIVREAQCRAHSDPWGGLREGRL